jgi:phage tail sheath protein FI
MSYKTALDVLSSKSDSEFNLLVTPGIRNEGVTNYAIDMVEDRFDALYLMDIDQYDKNGVLVTSAGQTVNADMTASTFSGKPYNSSFAAAYFPDVVIYDSELGGDIVVPPTVAVLGAFANNDAIAYSWFAPAGFTRGALDISAAATTFSRANLDNLYEAKINPITSFPESPYVVWGQKTLLKSASSLDRVNVRRLLIYIRRTVRAIALGFLFEPNRAETLEKFSAQINPFLQSIMDNNGLDRFKVKIDTETTTQIDVENNTLRGKIYVQPAKTAEFISIDFVVSNTL